MDAISNANISSAVKRKHLMSAFGKSECVVSFRQVKHCGLQFWRENDINKGKGFQKHGVFEEITSLCFLFYVFFLVFLVKIGNQQVMHLLIHVQ